MKDKQILQTLKNAYSEFFEYLWKQNAEDAKKGYTPIEPNFREFMMWLEEKKLSN